MIRAGLGYLFKLLFLPVCLLVIPSAYADQRVALVFDASGSMWGQIDGRTKIEIAREALKTVISEFPADRHVGLVAYGHRRKGDCADIETLIPVSPVDSARIAQAVDKIVPRGKTPLSAAVKHAAEELRFTEESATVILISDGVETCELDPCAMGKELAELGIDFTAHVIGFDIASVEDQRGLRCLAESTGGRFIAAKDASELNLALAETTKQVEEAPVIELTPTAKLAAPETAIRGSEITINLEAQAGLDGYIYLYRVGRDRAIAYARVFEDELEGYKPVKIRMPSVLGDYLLRWENNKKQQLGESAIEVVDAEIRLEAPAEALQGTEIEIKLIAPPALAGYIYLYRVGRDQSIVYDRAQEADIEGYRPAILRMPATPGDYVIKWETSSREVLAETPIVVSAVEVAIDAPTEAAKATTIPIKLHAPSGLTGYVYIYPAGRDKSISYVRVAEDAHGNYNTLRLELPATPGDYELKWLTSRNEVLATSPLKVQDAEFRIIAPSEVEASSRIRVAVEAPAGVRGYIYVYPEGSDKSLNYGRVREGNIEAYDPIEIRGPEAPGKYDLKWLTPKNEFLAHTSLKVVPPAD